MDLNILISDFNKKYDLIVKEVVDEQKYDNIEIFINHLNKHIKDFNNLNNESKILLNTVYI